MPSELRFLVFSDYRYCIEYFSLLHMLKSFSSFKQRANIFQWNVNVFHGIVANASISPLLPIKRTSGSSQILNRLTWRTWRANAAIS